MKILSIITMLMLVCSISLASDIPVQAKAVHNLYVAVNKKYPELLKKVWTRAYADRFSKRGWSETLKVYIEAWEAYGMAKWDLDKIRYNFKKISETEGEVEIFYEGKSYGSVMVLKENNTWLMNER